MVIDIAFALLYEYVFIVSAIVELIELAFKYLLQYARRHCSPTGLISYGLKQLEGLTDLIARIEAQLESGDPPIPPECSLRNLEELKEGRSW